MFLKNKKINTKKIYRDENSSNGITILEFIIYFAITLIMLTILVQTSMNIFSGREKVKAHQELNRNGRNAMDEITNAILESDEFVGSSE